MFDGFKIMVTVYAVVQRIALNPLFEFIVEVDDTTGEMVRKLAKYKGIEIIIIYATKQKDGTYKSLEYPKAIIKGSLHKFYNEGKHNYDNFNRNQLRQSIINLELIFGCEVLDAKIENVEFSVNIIPPIATTSLMNKISMYGRTPFKDGRFKNSDYKEVILQHYYVKIYDKGLQNYLHQNILRVEYKSKRMKPLNDIGLYCFGDLLKDEIYANLGRKLIDMWQKVLILDDSIRVDELTPKQQMDLNKWLNPNNWNKLTNHSNKKKFNQELERYKKVVANHSDNLHEQTRLLINKKWEKLTTIPKPKKVDLGKINDLCIVLKLPYSDIRCKVTNLPIGMQKESQFLCRSGIRFYYENYSGIYKYYLHVRLSEKQKLKSLTAQFDEIAHSVRNEYFNKIHNTRRGIKKLFCEPGLFDNMQLIEKEKLVLAGFLVNINKIQQYGI